MHIVIILCYLSCFVTQMKCCKRITHNMVNSWVGLQNHRRSIITTHHGYTTIVRYIQTHTHTCVLTLPILVTWPSSTANEARICCHTDRIHFFRWPTALFIHWWQCWHWRSCSKISFACFVKHLCLQAASMHTHTQAYIYMHAHIHTMLARTLH